MWFTYRDGKRVACGDSRSDTESVNSKYKSVNAESSYVFHDELATKDECRQTTLDEFLGGVTFTNAISVIEDRIKEINVEMVIFNSSFNRLTEIIEEINEAYEMIANDYI